MVAITTIIMSIDELKCDSIYLLNDLLWQSNRSLEKKTSTKKILTLQMFNMWCHVTTPQIDNSFNFSQCEVQLKSISLKILGCISLLHFHGSVRDIETIQLK